ncbi:lipopolysaccharide biosynthesis protein [Pediococcus pentosaceus]|jgi:O-antigen/teichoic acid export membrane protein|uniref:lipopolysaccharide biosynthesis protein n=1 Tax=Pediococcus pentosaceus TaxID=1255 RepID=UPI0021E92F5D|nr:lipopolysaccharide biosynthesis protein [Pediococcus pentosaceus]MCV3325611.1 lipopolysaccharide biosynthesis protein [Pediococcus pentosaceus]
MKNLIKFLKTSGIYLIGNVLTKAVAFIMLPIYTKYLSPTDYGTYDVNIAYITFLSSVLFLDIWSGMMRYMFDFRDIDGKKRPMLSGIIIFIMSTGVYALFTFSLGEVMNIQYLFWVFLYGLMMNLQQLFSYIIRGIGKNALFASAGLIGSIVTMLSNILFIAVYHAGYEFLYVSSILGSLFNILILMCGFNVLKLFNKENFDKGLTYEIFLFSLPLTINSVAWWFLTAFNRVMISNTLSVAENGIYAVANKFTSIMQLVDQAFQMAWQEISFEKGGSKDTNKGKFFSNAINEYIKFMSLGVAILLPLVRIVFPYFVDKSFNNALQIIPLALVATLFSSISSFLGGTITAIKQNKYLFTTTLSGTFINIIVIFFTIHTIGVQAASLSLGIGFLVVDIRRYILLKRHIELTFKFKQMLLIYVLLLGSSLIFIFGNILLNFATFLGLIIFTLFLYKEWLTKLI